MQKRQDGEAQNQHPRQKLVDSGPQWTETGAMGASGEEDVSRGGSHNISSC